MKRIKLAIGIASTGDIKSRTAFCLFTNLKSFPYEYEVIIKEGGALHANREQIVKLAIQMDCTHLIFIDSDMSFERDAIIRLLRRDKDIVGVHYNQRKNPPTTTVIMDTDTKLKLKEEHPDGFLTCDGVATGFMMIKLNVFKKLEHPWFFWESDENGDISVSEDYWFCRKAKEAGFDIWVDLSIPIKHIGDHLY
jgi:hypothetical protein